MPKSRVAVTQSVVGSLESLVPAQHGVPKGFLKTMPGNCLKSRLGPMVHMVEAFLQARSKSVHRGAEHWGEDRSWSWTEMEAEFLLIKKCQWMMFLENCWQAAGATGRMDMQKLLLQKDKIQRMSGSAAQGCTGSEEVVQN